MQLSIPGLEFEQGKEEQGYKVPYELQIEVSYQLLIQLNTKYSESSQEVFGIGYIGQ